MSNKLNNLFNSIGNNAIKNEKTSIEIIEEYVVNYFDKKFKVNEYTLLNTLGVKNDSGIINHYRGLVSQSAINDERKNLVNRLFLPFAKLENLVESEKKEVKTKLQKTLEKAENKQKFEANAQVKKTEQQIINNAIRTTANRIVLPTLLLISKGKDFFKFEKNQVKVYLKSLSNEQVKKTFGFDPSKAEVLAMACNLTVLEKLAKTVLLNVEVQRSIETTEKTENMESTTDEILKGDHSDDKSRTMIASICNMLNYLDTNQDYDAIFEVLNHIETLENYGNEIATLTEPVRKQGNNYEIFGNYAVKFDGIKDLEAKSFKDLQAKFLKTYSKQSA